MLSFIFLSQLFSTFSIPNSYFLLINMYNTYIITLSPEKSHYKYCLFAKFFIRQFRDLQNHTHMFFVASQPFSLTISRSAHKQQNSSPSRTRSVFLFPQFPDYQNCRRKCRHKICNRSCIHDSVNSHKKREQNQQGQ